MNKLGGSSSNNANAQQGGMDTTQQTGATGQTATGQEDYGDKGMFPHYVINGLQSNACADA